MKKEEKVEKDNPNGAAGAEEILHSESGTMPMTTAPGNIKEQTAESALDATSNRKMKEAKKDQASSEQG